MKKEKNKIKKVYIIAGIVVIILIAIIIACVVCRLKIKEKEEEEEEAASRYTYVRSNDGTETRIILPEKPIIYLYPEQPIAITVKLGKFENVTSIYPEYNDGWNVTAYPDGTLINQDNGRELYSLYWEGKDEITTNFDEGFVVKGSEVSKFLEEKLEILGLTEKEAEEFIIYWLPRLQNNEYNYIRFATLEEINEIMPIEFSVKPDTLIRILMEYKPIDSYIEIKEQKLEKQERKGFTAVEWGGTEIK